ncbi:MAG: UDP-N-acetylglucosamine 2-epimerase (non-hydrolyzing) [Polaribacter sp.]
MKKIIAIVGARPQFIKHFPLEKACEGKIELITIHTGQHYDTNMSEVFFDQLGMSKPDYMLNIGSSNHGLQTASIMIEIEKIIEVEEPDGMIVYGDTNSTLAGALVASKLHVPIFHIEAGLRSFNREMPEEINRVLTDHISELLFVPSEVAKNNLLKEGLSNGVHVVGDIMKDLILHCTQNKLVKAPKLDKDYFYATLHRPYNTDEKQRLHYVLKNLNKLQCKVIFSIHPRTRNAMKKFGIEEIKYHNIVFIDPQSYFDNLSYLAHSKGLITDSGGMQKEAYWLKKKCVTVRPETEWVETLVNNWNTLVFEQLEKINDYFNMEEEDWDENLYGKGDTSSKIIEGINQKLMR